MARRYGAGMRPSRPVACLVLPARRRHLVRVAAAILGPTARDEADAFASAVPLLLEFEGDPGGPIGEVEYAGQWLRDRPGSPLGPFLALFTAQRIRVASCLAADLDGRSHVDLPGHGRP